MNEQQELMDEYLPYADVVINLDDVEQPAITPKPASYTELAGLVLFFRHKGYRATFEPAR